jgi:hypothetical protein
VVPETTAGTVAVAALRAYRKPGVFTLLSSGGLVFLGYTARRKFRAAQPPA